MTNHDMGEGMSSPPKFPAGKLFCNCSKDNQTFIRLEASSARHNSWFFFFFSVAWESQTFHKEMRNYEPKDRYGRHDPPSRMRGRHRVHPVALMFQDNGQQLTWAPFLQTGTIPGVDIVP